MRGINPEKIPEFIKGDVDLVKKEARFVLIISPDERIVRISENDNPRLDVFAIVGPSQGFNRHWDEVLLAEIGISRTRPYNEVRGLARQSEQSNVHQRRKWFSLSPHQYQLIAPIVFRKMESLVHKRVCLWKTGPFSGNVFKLPTSRYYWSRKEKKLHSSNRRMPIIAGARFSVSLKDLFFVRDICWAEANLNNHLKNVIRGLVNFIDLRLNWYNHSYKGKRLFRNLDGAKQVEKVLENHFFRKHPHLLWEVVRCLKEEKKSRYWSRVAEMINWTEMEPEERKMAFMAVSHPCLSNPAARLGDIQVLITTGIDKKKNYIVLEVFPKKK